MLSYQGRQISAPDNLVVGFQNRKECKLAFVVYRDEKKVLRKEKSWNTWRDRSIEPLEIENKPIKGFVLSETKRRSRDWFGSGRNVWRVTHPKGFEFEISSNNLEAIISNCDIIKGEIMSECLFAWGGTDMSLVPTTSELYNEVIANTENLKKEKIKPSTLKVGDKVKFLNGEIATYVGKFKSFLSSGAWVEDDYQIVSSTNYWQRNQKVVKDGYNDCFEIKKCSAPLYGFKIEFENVTKVEFVLSPKIIEKISYTEMSDEEVDEIIYSNKYTLENSNRNFILPFKEDLSLKKLTDFIDVEFDINLSNENLTLENIKKYFGSGGSRFIDFKEDEQRVKVKKVWYYYVNALTEVMIDAIKNGTKTSNISSYYTDSLIQLMNKDLYSIYFKINGYKTKIKS